jgi:hypothetical protein
MSRVSTSVYIKRACLSRIVSCSSFLSHATSGLSYESIRYTLCVYHLRRSLARLSPAFARVSVRLPARLWCSLARPPLVFARRSVRSPAHPQLSLVQVFARPRVSGARLSERSPIIVILLTGPLNNSLKFNLANPDY